MYIYSLTYGQSIMICFYMMGLCVNFTLREVPPVLTAMLVFTVISIRTHSVLKTHSFYR